MSGYERHRQELMALADIQTDPEVKKKLTSAAQVLNAADCLLSGVRNAARRLGYEGDDYQDAFYFIQDRGAEVLEATRANQQVAYAKEVRGKLNELVAFINKHESENA